MRSKELSKQFQQINNLIKSTRLSTNDNLELQGHWGKYICILSAGFLENAISEIYAEFADQCSSPPIASFSRKNLNRINNPKSTKFIETAYAFKKQWGKELEQFFIDNPHKKNAIDSIMANRHLIAHGKSTSISVVRIKDFLKESIDVIDFIENQCYPAEMA
jgi:hypothetical protein